MAKHLIKIKFEYASSESTEYTPRTFQAQLRDTIGERCRIKLDEDGEGYDGVALIKTERSKKEILNDLKNDLGEFEFS